MKLDKLLKQQLLILPKSWKDFGYSSYYDCVVNESTKFLNLLCKLDDTENYGESKYIGDLTKENLISIVSNFRSMVLAVLQCYLNKGNPHEAYNVLNKWLTQKEPKSTNKPLLFFLEFDNIYPQHYRLRKTHSKVNIDFGDLFHIPFEERHNIQSNRYSISGYPTLYFSNSVFLAYKELGELDYDGLFVSKFRHTRHFNKTETLLDMTNKPVDNTVESKFKFIARWILLMACSVKVGFSTSPFKPEYILPQIIFQWVKNNIKIGSRKIIGIKYSSTKIIDNKDGFYGYFYNTAIPIRHSGKNGYCDTLAKQFCMTKPISFHEALKHTGETSIQGQVKSIEINGASVEYENTDFGKIEQVLSTSPYSEWFHVSGKA